MKKKFDILLSISLIVLSQDGRSICAVISHHEGFALDCTPSQAVVTQLAVLCFQRLTFKKGRLCIQVGGSATTSRRGSLVFCTIHLKFSTIRSSPQAHFPSILQCEKSTGAPADNQETKDSEIEQVQVNTGTVAGSIISKDHQTIELSQGIRTNSSSEARRDTFKMGNSNMYVLPWDIVGAGISQE